MLIFQTISPLQYSPPPPQWLVPLSVASGCIVLSEYGPRTRTFPLLRRGPWLYCIVSKLVVKGTNHWGENTVLLALVHVKKIMPTMRACISKTFSDLQHVPIYITHFRTHNRTLWLYRRASYARTFVSYI